MKQNKTQPAAFQEQVAYHSGELPIYIASADLSIYPGMGHPCHYHEDIEFLYAVRGHLTYSVNGQLCRIREGEGIFVNSRHLHYGFSEDGTNCAFFCVLINPILLSVLPYIEREYLQPLMRNSNFPYSRLSPEIPWQREILELLKQAYELYTRQSTGYVLDLQGCFYRIWGLLFRNMPVSLTGDDKNPDNKLNILRSMICYIQENLREKLNLASIAKAGHVSESSCCRLFQKYLNRSPIAFLNECRLDEACTLLRDTEMSITEVAGKAGFNGASYFTEQFRKQYGCTPSQYRDRMRSR